MTYQRFAEARLKTLLKKKEKEAMRYLFTMDCGDTVIKDCEASITYQNIILSGPHRAHLKVHLKETFIDSVYNRFS